MAKPKTVVKAAKIGDLDRLLQVKDPHDRDEYADFLRARIDKSCVYVLVHGPTQQIIGFVVYNLTKASLMVLDFVIEESFRLQGFGTILMTQTKRIATNRQIKVEISVLERCVVMQLFLRAVGFKCEKILKKKSSVPSYLFMWEKHG